VPIVETSHRPTELIGSGGRAELEMLRGRPVAAFCGLGNPDAFRRTLVDQGANVTAFRTFADHHPYNRDDVADLRRWAAGLPADTHVVTSQKDLVKLCLPDLEGRPLWALRIRLQVDAGQEVLEQHLRAALTRYSEAKDSQ
jgi:tetraacyldisaccharide 4'-kinase